MPATDLERVFEQVQRYTRPVTVRQAPRPIVATIGSFTGGLRASKPRIRKSSQPPQARENASKVAAIGTPSLVPAARAPPSRNSSGSKCSQPRPSM